MGGDYIQGEESIQGHIKSLPPLTMSSSSTSLAERVHTLAVSSLTLAGGLSEGGREGEVMGGGHMQ